MTPINDEFHETFFSLFKKVGVLSDDQIKILSAIVDTLVVDRRFSIAKVIERVDHPITENEIGEALNAYHNCQVFLVEAIFCFYLSPLRKNLRLVLSIDDHLVKKRGKKTAGAERWYDHVTQQSGQAFCLVDLVLVVHGKIVLALPWLIYHKEPPTKQSKKKQSQETKEQDLKALAALQLIDWLVPLLCDLGWRRNRIQLVMDRWYCSAFVRRELNKRNINFRIAGKKNLLVQVPDWKRINTRGKPKRGPKYKHFRKYIRLDKYFHEDLKWQIFTCPFTGKLVWYHIAIVTLKVGGKARIYAFFREGCSEVLHIFTPAKYKTKPGAQLIYQDYYHRWPIEEAHRDLKQQFGLGSFTQRREPLVSAFISLIYLAYSIFCWSRYQQWQNTHEWLTSPAFQDTLIRSVYATSTG